jgi:putative MATE family efflux protein
MNLRLAGDKAAPKEGAASDQRKTLSLLDRPGPLWRLVVYLALPVLAQQALVLSVSLSDRFLAGRLEPLPRAAQAAAIGHEVAVLGQLAGGLLPGNGLTGAMAAETSWESARQIHARHISYQAAQTMAIYVGWMISSLTVLISVGSTALVARFIGAGNRAAAVRVTNQSILLAVMLGVVGTAVGLPGLKTFVALLGLHGDAGVFAAQYMRPLIVLLVFQVIESAGIACFIGAGDTRMGFYVLGGVALLNLPLAWGFFLGWGPFPELRFTGIAVGTAISHTLGGIAVLLALAGGRAGLRIRARDLWPDWGLIWRILRISIPAGIDSLTIMGGHLWFFSIVNQLGDAAIGAHGIALGWEQMSFLCGIAFGTAAMTLVGQNLGAGRPGMASRSGWVAFALGGGMMAIMGAVFFALAPQMFRLFCPLPEQQPIVAAGVPVLRLEAFAEPALASLMVFLSALRGAGDTRLPMLFNCIGVLGIRVPLAYLLTRDSLNLGPLGSVPAWNLGLFGAWLAMFSDLYVRGIFMLGRFAGGKWKLVRV